jgi:hypothetical protein
MGIIHGQRLTADAEALYGLVWAAVNDLRELPDLAKASKVATA